MAYKSAYKFTMQALRGALSDAGISTGGTGAIPRIELHSFIEAQPLDKDLQVRRFSAVLEAMSNVSMADAHTRLADCLAALDGLSAADTEFRLLGVLPTQLQDLTETADADTIIYRQLQTLDLTIEQI